MSEIKVYTVKEVAAILRLHPQTVVRLLKDGDLRGALIGREWRISDEAVREYLGGRGGHPKPEALAIIPEPAMDPA